MLAMQDRADSANPQEVITMLICSGYSQKEKAYLDMISPLSTWQGADHT